MFEYLQSDDVSHENVEERNASSFFFLFFLSFFLFQREIKSVIKVYGIGRGWMSAGWREIVRLFVLAEPIPQSSATEGLKRFPASPLSLSPLSSPSSPGGGTGHAMQAGRMHRRCNVCRSNRLYNEMNACSLLTENIERS